MSFRPTVISGARLLVYINGKLYGRCTSFSWTSNTPRKVIRTIDIPYPVELAATITEVSWNMSVLRLIADGGLQGAGVVANQTDISKEKYFSLVLIERESDEPIFKADFCATNSESWTAPAKGLVSGNVSGSGIIWTNEAG